MSGDRPTLPGGAGGLSAVVGVAVGALGGSGVVGRLLLLERPAWAAAMAAFAVVFGVLLTLRRLGGPGGAVVLAALVAVCAWVARNGMGRAPVLVCAMSVLLVRLAASRKLSAGPGDRVPSVVLTLPLVGAQLLLLRAPSVVPGVVMLAIAAGAVAGSARWPETFSGLDVRLRSGATVAGRWAAVGVVAVVAVPLLYLPGLVGRGIGSRRVRGSPTWSVPAGAARSGHRRPFGPTPARDRRRRTLAGAVTAVVIVGVVVGIRTEGPVAVESPESLVVDVPLGELPAFRGLAWADELQREQREFAGSLVSDPRTITASPDFAGEFTNVVDGVRRTSTTTCRDCPEVRVWLVGGSAAFGMGQRDDGTIASELVRLGRRDGLALGVVNLGVPGWTVQQEAVEIIDRIRSGEIGRSALVIVLDGFNDGVAAIAEIVATGALPPDGPSVLRGEYLQGLIDTPVATGPSLGPDEIAAVAAARFERKRAELMTVAKEAGVTVRFFTQPDALASLRQLDGVREALHPVVRQRVGLFAAVLARLDELLARGGSRSQRRLFDEVAEPLFADLVHTNEQGAARVARAIYTDLRTLLEQLAGSR